MQKFKTALFGTGFVGRVHLEGIRRLGYVQLYAIGEPLIEKANQLAAEFGAEKTDPDYRRILQDPAVDAVHICTPNAFHFPIAKDALEAGKHVICEKPLATSMEQAQQLVALARQTGRRNCTFHNLRFYPMVQHMRRMRERTRGSFTASQISAGRKNRLSIEIYGTKCGVAWDQERQDELWIGNRNTNNQIIVKDPSLLKAKAKSYADLPGGHSEGYDDTFKQVFRRFYQSIEDPAAQPEYPQFADGLRQLTILQAELDSHARRAWVDVP